MQGILSLLWEKVWKVFCPLLWEKENTVKVFPPVMEEREHCQGILSPVMGEGEHCQGILSPVMGEGEHCQGFVSPVMGEKEQMASRPRKAPIISKGTVCLCQLIESGGGHIGWRRWLTLHV